MRTSTVRASLAAAVSLMSLAVGCQAVCACEFGSTQSIIYGIVRTDSGTAIQGFDLRAIALENPVPGCGFSDAQGQAFSATTGKYRMMLYAHNAPMDSVCVELSGRRLPISDYIPLDTVRGRLQAAAPFDSVRRDVVLPAIPLPPASAQP